MTHHVERVMKPCCPCSWGSWKSADELGAVGGPRRGGTETSLGESPPGRLAGVNRGGTFRCVCALNEDVEHILEDASEAIDVIARICRGSAKPLGRDVPGAAPLPDRAARSRDAEVAEH